MEVIRRNRPGTKVSEFYNWKPLTLKELEELGSPFANQIYIQQKIREDPSQVEKLVALPEGANKDIWIYEHLRQVVTELHDFVRFHDDLITAEKYPVMKLKVKGETMTFKSTAFKKPREVPAIDYMTQTIESSQDILNDSDLFPSRAYVPEASAKNFSQIARRLYRIFVFAHEETKERFLEYERKHFLYSRFVKLSLNYDLIEKDQLMIPIDVLQN